MNIECSSIEGSRLNDKYVHVVVCVNIECSSIESVVGLGAVG